MIDIKSGNSIIRVKKLRLNQAKLYIDVRKMYKDVTSEKQELKHTAKGIFIPLDLGKAIAEAIVKESESKEIEEVTLGKKH